MRTKEGWDKSRQDLDQYLDVGDVVDDEIYDYFLGVLPPACNSGKCLQIGEPNHHNADGQPCFATLMKSGDVWKYAGHLPTPATEKCLYE